VLNLRFTGEPAGRERSVRQVWGGALCVSGAEHTEAALVAVQQLRQEVDRRYGAGTVILDGWLRPLS
jgi:hypothetical protein